MKAPTTCLLIIDKNQSRQVKNLNQKRMQEHTKKPAISYNNAGNYPDLFPALMLALF
jgi:hypothetical protein